MRTRIHTCTHMCCGHITCTTAKTHAHGKSTCITTTGLERLRAQARVAGDEPTPYQRKGTHASYTPAEKVDLSTYHIHSSSPPLSSRPCRKDSSLADTIITFSAGIKKASMTRVLCRPRLQSAACNLEPQFLARSRGPGFVQNPYARYQYCVRSREYHVSVRTCIRKLPT